MPGPSHDWEEIGALRSLTNEARFDSLATLYVDDSARYSKAVEMLVLWTGTKPVKVKLMQAPTPDEASSPYLSLREDRDRIILNLFGSNGSQLEEVAIPLSLPTWPERLQAAVNRLALRSGGNK